nr:MAG TPA: hypothetical protein [Caudoviricetes sp.]
MTLNIINNPIYQPGHALFHSGEETSLKTMTYIGQFKTIKI